MHEVTTPYSSKSNRRAKRLNRTFLDVARTMIMCLLGKGTVMRLLTVLTTYGTGCKLGVAGKIWLTV